MRTALKTAVVLAVLLAASLPSAAPAAVETAPYGFALLNTSYNTRSLVDVPVTAPSPQSGNEPSFDMFARQTRFGLKMKSDGTYTPSGAIEVDFYGLRGSGANGGPTQFAPRLRRAFMELHFEQFDILAGQEWMVFSPLNPTSLMHVALPGMMSSGNLWARLPQVRGTLKPVKSETMEVKVDAAIVRPFGADFDAAPPVTQADPLGRGERYGWPWIQGRLGVAMKGETKITAGVGGHFGLEDFGDDPAGDDLTATSLAIGGDVQVGVGQLTLSGEAFIGRNIHMLFSNATFAMVPDSVQVNDDYRPFQTPEEIKAIGGWGEAKFAVDPKLDVVASGGLEKIDEEFLANGAIQGNLTIMGAVILKPTAGVQIGLEGGLISTKFKGNDPGTADAEEDFNRKNLNGNLSFMFTF